MNQNIYKVCVKLGATYEEFNPKQNIQEGNDQLQRVTS